MKFITKHSTFSSQFGSPVVRKNNRRPHAATFSAPYSPGVSNPSSAVIRIIRDVACAGLSRRFPVGDLATDGWAGSPTGGEASHLPAGTESCVWPGDRPGEA